jgi:ribosomal protein L35AE/L33A
MGMAEETVVHQQLLEYARTTVELGLLLEEIRLLQDALYSTQGDGMERVLQEKVRFEVAQSLREILNTHQANQHELLESIREVALQQKTLSLTVAFRPSSAFVSTIVSWVRSHIGAGVVLDFRYEPAVVGGAVIEFNGHYGDFSLKKKFQNYFDAKLLGKHVVTKSEAEPQFDQSNS